MGRGRFELPTSRLSSARSNQLSYRPVAFGGGDRDRTDDLLLAKQALSQLSYGPAGPPEAKTSEIGRPQIVYDVWLLALDA